MTDKASKNLEGPSRLGWELVDPRSTQEENPYTFFVPSEAEKNALVGGDLVKLIFESCDPNGGSVERMWVIYRDRDENGWYGQLDNEPFDIEGLSRGDEIHFKDFNIVGVWDTKIDSMDDEDRYFARCHVDQRIIDGSARIGRLERRKPKWFWWWQRKHQRFSDTGWHIFAEDNSTHKSAKMSYLAIGVVLNKDDSYLRLLDAPVGACLVRNGNEFHLG
ncbi:DUF2185 domain-containing protein [Tateyamaria sp.]|uniref:immunity protein Imm33 domain-containing protein n=1 Tax=Tateyamaria sp. TaxID=1929288 RepID=UPI00329F5686